MSDPVIQIEGVSKWYTPGTPVLRACTLAMARGEVVVVCGPSGSGKSTLIKNPEPLTGNQEHDPSNGIKGGKRASTAMSLKSERPVNS